MLLICYTWQVRQNKMSILIAKEAENKGTPS